MLKRLAIFTVIAVIGIVLACGESDDTVTDPQGANAIVDEANDSLANVLFELVNQDSVSSPDEIDFTAVNQLYKDALELDPDNLDANFGAGLTELLMVFVDPQVNATFDEWEAFLDTASIFEPPGGGLAKDLNNPAELFSISPAILSSYSAGVFKMALVDPPMISSIQDLVENEVFPRVAYAIEKLEVVAENPSYTFIITPHMQGDDTEDPIEIDLTEVYVAIAQLYAMKSIGNIFISYDFDIASYDSVGLEEMIDQNSDFLGLRTGGAAAMGDVKSSFLTAVANLGFAITFLRAETDNQVDDLIRIGPDDIDEADLDSLENHLPDFLDILNDSYELTEDFNDDGVDETISISIGAIFDDPISNIKQKLPPYTSHVVRDTSWYTYWDWHPDSGWYEIEEIDEIHWTGVILWDALTFDDWIFPDPTFNGLFPGMTDAEMKETFGITAEDWEREMRMEFE